MSHSDRNDPLRDAKLRNWRAKADEFLSKAEACASPDRAAYEQLACNCAMVAEWLEENTADPDFPGW
jgi:hypothetical protein